jgi:hypothetical protein
MSLFTLGDAVDLTDLSIQKIFLKETDLEKRTFYDKYFNVETGVVDLYTKDSSLSGLGSAGRITENAVITSEAPVQGFDKTYTQVEFGKMLPVTKQMWKFGIKKRSLERVATSLKKACLRAREELCAARLDNSFATSYTQADDSGSYTVPTAGGDSKALIANDHTREDGGTNWNNRVTDGTTVNMDFDYDAIKAAHRTASLILDPKGKKMDIVLDTLVVTRGTTAAFRAREILGAIKAGGKNSIPGSADNDAAGVAAFNVIELPYVSTNTSYWWMFDSSMKGDEFGLQYKESQGISLEGPNVVFKTGEIQYKSTMLFDIGFNDSRNWVGSKNTNAS